MKNKWTILLLLIVIIDSISTVYIFGMESNPLILWVMKSFDLSLKSAMIWRIVYYLPLLFILDKTKYSKHVFISYLIIYSGALGISLL